ncbi:MAG TPA: NADH-quinone oxidoreductase subunit I [Ignavibacteriales bacterium]|nr:NADH-quinone oxidoreductase subunit I [Ignavibacteriales bacterium]HOL80582.1 NADH-quinone oxidoreductase subunit I [Ignavibacteriales bacterium]HOM64272.1 NADH-quinone oxidoreductase subunit I [Ignavibacteriales bacterium]HPD68441.1 NADH-quinone oxidoreductase subunit I [Ignavibacteriales bacterium]HPP33082.1 NADH-quinone oxidoreductase subunit I [Ignavibacteriales bacterium]
MEKKIRVRHKDLTLLQKTYLPQTVKGLLQTFKQMFKPKFTMEYPEVKFEPPSSYRGRPVLVQEDDGRERCVACGLCSRVCPALAIEVRANETDLEKERYPEVFEINMLRCIFCGLCEEVCPEEAIVMSKDYELAFHHREDAIYGKDKLLVPVDKLQDRIDFIRKYK